MDEDFEAWMRSTGETPSAFMEHNECYVDSRVQVQWIAFRAGREYSNKQSEMTLEQKRDEHVQWTRQHYGNDCAKEIMDIYNKGLAMQSNKQSVVTFHHCERCGRTWEFTNAENVPMRLVECGCHTKT